MNLIARLETPMCKTFARFNTKDSFLWDTLIDLLIWLDTQLLFENWRQKWSEVNNEDIAVMVAKCYINEVDIIQEKVFNIFLLPNKKEWKLKIFRREGFDEYLNMCAVFIKNY